MPESATAFGNLQIALGEQREEERKKVIMLSHKGALQMSSDPSKAVPFIPPIIEKKKRPQIAGERAEIIEGFFAAFKREEHLTLKELQTRCSCSEQDLKPMLQEFCEYNKKGSFKNFYNLKREFKA
jgi:hypothetical protein